MATPEARVKKILLDQLHVNLEQLQPEADLAHDLGADSLDAVDIVMEIEEVFDIAISQEEEENIQTVGDIIALVEAKVA
jgi:acyl carrier protein